jgi:16S rRNA (cytidine1402-2'-O)-methyltransferase
MRDVRFYLVGTPIGNLDDITLRALKVLKDVDLIYCEDTRRTIKLLHHFQVSKVLRSCPYFKERKVSEEIVNELRDGKKIAYVSDAGMPGLCDPGAVLISAVRKAGFDVDVIGGVSALTHFVSLLGRDLDEFSFCGFLPEKRERKRRFLESKNECNLLFFESKHRLESSLAIMAELSPNRLLSLGKEFTKISESFFEGTPKDLRAEINSWKGEWVGLWWKE